LAAAAAQFLWMPGVAHAQRPSDFLAVEGVNVDAGASKLRVTVKNVGQQKITGCAMRVSSQQYTQEFVYSVGMEARLALPRPPGFGGIQPGESVELLFPLAAGGAPTAEVNAVILEDRTATGDEAEIAAIFRQRQAFATEWEHWAMAMQEDPAHVRTPAEQSSEQTEMLRVFRQGLDEGADTTVSSGRMAARRALASFLARETAASRAAARGYVQERSGVFRQHAQRAGWTSVPSYLPAPGDVAGANLSVSAVRTDPFSCLYPGQSVGISGHADVLERHRATRDAASTSKVAELAASANGTCGTTGPSSAIAPPLCSPEFFTTTSLSPSAATITAVTYSYVASFGCTVTMGQTTTTVGSSVRQPVAEYSPACPQQCPPNPIPPIPQGLNAATYAETITAPTGPQWGATQAHAVTVDITAYYDVGSDTWKAKLTTANEAYNIWYRLLPGVQEASAAAATQANFCTMATDLRTLGYPPGRAAQWYKVSAVEAHERQHVNEIKQSIAAAFPALTAAIGGLSVANACNLNLNAGSAAAAIKALPGYNAAVTAFNNNWITAYNAIPDPNANTDAAEHAVVDPVVAAILQKAAANGWGACP
jgi:hypothetical protein